MPAAEQTILSPGLYIVATPIGNLAEISQRALEVLARVEMVLCEDTRNSRRLLQHYGLVGQLRAHHRFNEQASQQRILLQLAAGATMALVSDAGTPCISDPGRRLVAACHEHNIRVVPISGPSAITTALMASGMAEDGFVFAGFPPAKEAARRAWLAKKLSLGQALIVFEAPHRLLALLHDLSELAGRQHRLCVARELSKHFEQIRAGSLGEQINWFNKNPQSLRGECTLVIEPLQPAQPREQKFFTDPATMARLFDDCGVPVSVASSALARVSGLPKRLCYQICLEHKHK